MCIEMIIIIIIITVIIVIIIIFIIRTGGILVTGVIGGSVQLPCNITPPSVGDRTQVCLKEAIPYKKKVLINKYY